LQPDVDDFLGFSSSPRLTKELRDAINLKYGDARFSGEPILRYIGMTITQPRDGREQVEYTKRIIQAAGVTKGNYNPNHPRLHLPKKMQTASAPVDKTRFLSLLMSAMYLGMRTRPDILAPLSYLGNRVTAPDESDMTCLLRVYEYLYATPDYGLIFQPTSMQLYYWVDAAYTAHYEDLTSV